VGKNVRLPPFAQDQDGNKVDVALAACEAYYGFGRCEEISDSCSDTGYKQIGTHSCNWDYIGCEFLNAPEDQQYAADNTLPMANPNYYSNPIYNENAHHLNSYSSSGQSVGELAAFMRCKHKRGNSGTNSWVLEIDDLSTCSLHELGEWAIGPNSTNPASTPVTSSSLASTGCLCENCSEYRIPSPLQVGYSGVMTCADLRTASSCTGVYCADGYQGTVAYADGDHPGDNVKLSGCQLIEHFCKGDPSTGAFVLSVAATPVRKRVLKADGVVRCGLMHCSGDILLGQQRHQYISARIVRRYSRQQRVSPERYVHYPQQCSGERRHECLLRHGDRWRRLDAGPANQRQHDEFIKI
jgi:hypothetical protein